MINPTILLLHTYKLCKSRIYSIHTPTHTTNSADYSLTPKAQNFKPKQIPEKQSHTTSTDSAQKHYEIGRSHKNQAYNATTKKRTYILITHHPTPIQVHPIQNSTHQEGPTLQSIQSWPQCSIHGTKRIHQSPIISFHQIQ
jgi:hypothetical protein